MKHKNIIFSLAIITAALNAAGQVTGSNLKDVTRALELSDKHPREDLVTLNAQIKYTFLLNKEGDKVLAMEDNKQSIMSLYGSLVLNDGIMYDDESEILEFKGKTKGGYKPVPFYRTYERDGIFHDDAMICSFKLPFSYMGEIADYSYIKKYKDVKYLNRIFFSEYRPVEEKTVTFVVPDWLEVEFKEFNFDKHTIEKSSVPNKSTRTTTYTFTAKKLPALRNEKASPSPASAAPHIVILCKSFTNKKKQKFTLFQNMNDLYKWCNELCKKTDNDTTDISPIVQGLMQGKTKDEEKLEAIYYWVQDNIRYIAREEGILGYQPIEADKVFHRRYGDCKGMANLTKTMLKMAGFDARLVWLGTQGIPYNNDLPTLVVYNHMICAVFIKDKRYFLDPTEKYIALGDYAHRIQGRPVMIEDGDKFLTDKIPSFGHERNLSESFIQMELSGDKIKGTRKNILNGEVKTVFLRGYSNLRSDYKEDALNRYLGSSDKNITVLNVTNTDFEERQKPFEINYSFEINNQVVQTGNKLYVHLETDKEYMKWHFDSLRKNDFELDNKVLILAHAKFTIPAGYKVESLPPAVSQKHGNFTFELSYRVENGQVIYEKKIIIPNALIPKKDFTTWNKCVKELSSSYRSPLVLTR